MSVEIKVISGGAMRRFLSEAVPLFEREGGHEVAIQFGLTRDMKAAIEAGAAFDLALLPRSALDDLVQVGKIAPGAITDVVRSLVDAANAAGGDDNVTVIVAQLLPVVGTNETAVELSALQPAG